MPTFGIVKKREQVQPRKIRMNKLQLFVIAKLDFILSDVSRIESKGDLVDYRKFVNSRNNLFLFFLIVEIKFVYEVYILNKTNKIYRNIATPTPNPSLNHLILYMLRCNARKPKKIRKRFTF